MKVSKLNGMKVITVDAFTLGQIAGAPVDTNKWEITNLDVTLTKDATEELGFKKPFMGSVTVCLSVDIVKGIGDVIILEKSLHEMKELKECKKE